MGTILIALAKTLSSIMFAEQRELVVLYELLNFFFDTA